MELKSGYKQTEVGVIPEDWLTLTYGKVFDFLKTATYSRAEVRSTEGVLYVHYGDIHTEWDGFVDFNTANVCCVTDEQAKAYSLLKNGDLIMADASEDYGGIGKSVEVKNLDNRKAISGLHTFVLRDSENIIADGYRGYLHSNKQIKKQFDRLATGMKVFGVSRNNLKTVLIPLPPTKAEQEAIAEALSDADALIASLEQLIAKKRLIKQGTMQELLTGKRRLPGFSGDWEEKTLGDVIEHCSSGATPYRGRPEYYTGSVRWITSGELNYGRICETEEHISETAVFDTNLKIHPEGVFLMAITGLEAAGTRGACGIVGAPSTTNQSCMAIYPTKALTTDYLFYYYTYHGESLALKFCQGTKQQSYTAKLVKKLPIYLPPNIEEQDAISKVLSDMDHELKSLEAKLSKARLLKQGMMQELLTGRIRLNQNT